MDSYIQKLISFYCDIKNQEEKEKLSFLIYDFFVRENHSILSSLQHEELISKILINLKNLDMEKITSKSKIKLQDTIYSLTRPGKKFLKFIKFSLKRTTCLSNKNCEKKCIYNFRCFVSCKS